MSRRWRGVALGTGLAVVAAPAAFAAPGSGPHRGSYGPADTGVVRVAPAPGYAEGEQPLSVNPLNPDELIAAANVFHPNLPGPASTYVGGGGLDDSRLYVSRDGGRHWRTLKLDQGGLGT